MSEIERGLFQSLLSSSLYWISVWFRLHNSRELFLKVAILSCRSCLAASRKHLFSLVGCLVKRLNEQFKAITVHKPTSWSHAQYGKFRNVVGSIYNNFLALKNTSKFKKSKATSCSTNDLHPFLMANPFCGRNFAVQIGEEDSSKFHKSSLVDPVLLWQET
jgi:hypothetical protein